MEWIKSEYSKNYFENEWCIPAHDDKIIFEFMVLEMMQAGLSWEIILQKREAVREAFSGFDCNAIADYKEKDIERLLQNPKIIRNKLKISAVINNARKFIETQKIYGSFDKYIWSFTDYKVIDHKLTVKDKPPSKNDLSETVSKDLKKRGFKFMGAVICYSFLQAIGIVNDRPLEYRK